MESQRQIDPSVPAFAEQAVNVRTSTRMPPVTPKVCNRAGKKSRRNKKKGRKK